MKTLFLALLISLNSHAKEAIFKPIENIKKQTIKKPGFEILRDSSSSVEVTMSPMDEIRVETCFEAGGVTFFLQGKRGDLADKGDTIQDAPIGDTAFWGKQIYTNKKAVHVKLEKPVKEGFWETHMQIIRASDDLSYVVKLIGLPCPNGLTNFPRSVYIRPKDMSIEPEKMLTAEQAIVESTYGFDRENLDAVEIGKMVTTSGAAYVSLDLTVIPKMSIEKNSDIEIVVLDNFGINKLKSDNVYLKEYSKKAIRVLKKQVMKYALKVYVDKNYILDSRFINVIYINKKTQTYQMLYKVDLLKRFQELKVKEGYDI